MLTQIMEGKKSEDPTVASDHEDNEEALGYSASLIKTLMPFLSAIYQATRDFISQEKTSHFACIYKQQQEDQQLLARQEKYSERYVYKTLDEDPYCIICYVLPGNNPDEEWYIALPLQMLDQAVKWFHHGMGHPQEKHLHENLSTVTIIPKVR